MNDRDRTRAAGLVSLVGAVMVIVGLLLLRAPGVLRFVGIALLALGATGVLQGVAIGLGVGGRAFDADGPQRGGPSVAPARREPNASVGPAPAPRARRFDRLQIAAIFVGGFVGSIARAALERHAPHEPGSWPWATFAVNLVGAFLLGYFVARLGERLPLSAYRRPLLATGFCGTLTTFSTMQLELLHMLAAHDVGLAIAYGAASLVGGLLSLRLAIALVRRARILA